MNPDSEFHTEATASPFGNVPIEVVVSVGRAKPKISDLMSMQPNTLLLLDRSVNDLVDISVNGKLIARGNLEESKDGVDGKLSVRIAELVVGDS